MATPPRSGPASRPPMPPVADARLRTRDAIALGLLHGPAELLPVSSSAHVTLVPWLLGWPYASLDPDLRKSFEVALHAGTLAALLVGLRAEVVAELRALDRDRARRLALSTLPPAVAGLAFERAIAATARRTAADRDRARGRGASRWRRPTRRGARTRRREDATDVRRAGARARAGVRAASRASRAAAPTLTVARARGFARADAGVLSLQAALPVIAGAALPEGARASRAQRPAGRRRRRDSPPGSAASFAGSLAAIRVVRASDRDRSLLPYAAYRIALATVVLRRPDPLRDPDAYLADAPAGVRSAADSPDLIALRAVRAIRRTRSCIRRLTTACGCTIGPWLHRSAPCSPSAIASTRRSGPGGCRPSTARSTPCWSARSRSSSCTARSPGTPTSSSASAARRARSRSSTTRTSSASSTPARRTAARTASRRRTSSSSTSRARR